MGGRNGGNLKTRPSNSTGNSGYESPTASVRTDLKAKHQTEAGMSAKLAAAVLAGEEKIRNFKKEKLLIFDENGNLLHEKLGGKASVSFPTHWVQKNSVITHNHPDEMHKTSRFGGVGVSLSGADLNSAVHGNAREVRAVTRDYVYSIKRPKGGWGVTAYQIQSDFDTDFKARLKTFRAKVKGITDPKERTRAYDQFNMTACHQILKRLSNKYGLIYTRRKSSK